MTMRRSLPAAQLLALLLAALPGLAAAQPMTLQVSPDTVRADDTFTWQARITIRNGTERGLYVDSIRVIITDADSGLSRIETVSRRPVPVLTEAIGAGEVSDQSFSSPVSCEWGDMRVVAWGHDSEKRVHQVEATVRIAPGRFAREHPSRFVTSQGQRCELVVARPDSTPAGGAPAVLLVHGHGSHARKLMPVLSTLAGRGYVAMAVSMPGYGLSGGKADFMGPATVQALSDAYDALRREPGVDARRIGVWGWSRGATAGALLAARRTLISAVVAQSASYDLWATYRHTQIPGMRENIVAEAGTDSAAWSARSPLLQAERISSPFLILHGEDDERTPASAARAFHARLQAQGRPVEATFFRSGHTLPRGPATQASLRFLDQRLLK
jgi:dienelactone hydrolase